MSDYIKNSSQSVGDDKFEDDSEEEEEDEERPVANARNGRKRNLELDDSPPHGRVSKRRA